MKTKLLLTIVLALQAVFTFAQPDVFACSYFRCDTCFTFTALPDTTAGIAPYTYQWTFKGTTPATFTGKIITYCIHQHPVNYSDSLFLTITDANNQHQYYFNSLTSMLPGLDNTTIQPICIITVDTSVNKNMIVWEQSTDTLITSYNLYKETTTSGVYSLLANIPRHALSAFTDTSSQPQIKSAKYYFTTKDTCGFESQSGVPHKTMHLTINSGIPPAWNLLWENYEGLSFTKYRIWRKSISSGWQLIDSVSSSSTTYTDLTPPPGLLNYLLEIRSPVICTPTLKTENVNTIYSSSLSNIAANGFAGINEINFSNSIHIFPNPACDIVTLSIDNANNADLILNIYNVIGTLVKSEILKQNNRQINIGDLRNGVYMVTIKSKDYTVNKRLIIQR